MATIFASPDVAFDMYETGIASALSQTITAVESNRIELARGENYSEILEGTSLSSTADGVVNRVTEKINGITAFIVDGLSTPIASILAWGEDGDYQAFFNYTLAGNDTVIGSDLDDRIFSGPGNDVVEAGAGDDEIDAGHGYEIIDGGDGYDSLILSRDSEEYSIFQLGDMYVLQSGVEHLKITNVESFYFADGVDLKSKELVSTITAFDGLGYLASYADLFTAFGTDGSAGTAHFAAYGFSEGRGVTFNGLDYIASYQDLRNAFGTDADAGARHFIQWGFSEHRGTTFEGWTYLASYADLMTAFGADESAATRHYIEWGAKEGRTASFDAAAYARDNPDVVAAIGNDPQALARYYVMYEYTDGRPFSATNNLAFAPETQSHASQTVQPMAAPSYSSGGLSYGESFDSLGYGIADWTSATSHLDAFGLA